MTDLYRTLDGTLRAARLAGGLTLFAGGRTAAVLTPLEARDLAAAILRGVAPNGSEPLQAHPAPAPQRRPRPGPGPKEPTPRRQRTRAPRETKQQNGALPR